MHLHFTPLLLPASPASPLPARLANHDRVGGAIKAAAQLVDSTATQVQMGRLPLVVVQRIFRRPFSTLPSVGHA